MLKILYVEDDPLNRLIVERAMSHHFIELASTAELALQKASKQIFDVFLLDINLGPDSISGIELMASLRSLVFPKVPLFAALTAYAMPGDKERFLNFGFDVYFSKPVDLHGLVDYFDAMLKI